MRVSAPKIIWIFLFMFIFYVLIQVLQKERFVKIQETNKKNMFFRTMLSVECSFIFVMTLFGRTRNNYGVIIRPFESYAMAFKIMNIEIILQIIMNIVMYVPFGFLLPCCFKNNRKAKNVLFITFACSMGIELIQGVVGIGLFEIDDILNNTLGAALGFFLYKVIVKVRKWKSQEIRRV